MKRVIEEAKGTNRNYFLWGATGTGKTRTAQELAKAKGDKAPYNKDLGRLWSRYQGQKVVLLDNVTRMTAKYIQHKINTWGDNNTFDAPIRKTREDDDEDDDNPENIKTIDPRDFNLIICSYYSPDELFNWDEEMDKEKFSRIYTVIHTDENYLNN